MNWCPNPSSIIMSVGRCWGVGVDLISGSKWVNCLCVTEVHEQRAGLGVSMKRF